MHKRKFSGQFNICFAWSSILMVLTGCTSSGMVHQLSSDQAEINRVENHSMTAKGEMTPLYEIDGHYSTAGYVALLAGYDKERVLAISCYTQMPDEEAVTYSAPYVAVWGVVNPPYRHRIVNGLHSLHGGGPEEVERRRLLLKNLIIHQVRDRGADTDWQLGFLIHALGDSYAHVHGDPGEQVAYGEFIGHALANTPWGENPDSIFVGEHYKNYNKYVVALFEALTVDNPDVGTKRLILDQFTQLVGVEAEKGDSKSKKVTILIDQNTSIVKGSSGGDAGLCKDLNASVDREATYRFLSALNESLK